MAEITATSVQAITTTPMGSFVLINGTVHLDIAQFLGVPAPSLDAVIVTQLLLKLAQQAKAAQDAYNTPSGGTALPTTQTLKALSTPTFKTPVFSSNGEAVYTDVSYTITARISSTTNNVVTPV